MKKSTPDFLTKYSFSYDSLCYELNKLTPNKTKWIAYFPEGSELKFEHEEKGTAFIEILRYEDGRMCFLSVEESQLLGRITPKIVDIEGIISNVPQYPPHFKESYEAIAKYLIEQVFDNWLK
jgi:hypothetical protein